jgi:hypothetical protein
MAGTNNTYYFYPHLIQKKKDTKVHTALRHIGNTIGYKNQGNKSGCVDGVLMYQWNMYNIKGTCKLET